MPVARAYVRVSALVGRGEGGEALLSPDVQLDAARAFCRLHGLTLDEAASVANQDLDVSGWRRTWKKRPGLVAHLDDANAGRFSHLIVYKLSRLARSAREGLEIFDAFEKAGVAISVVREGIDTATATGRMVRTMLLAVAEMQAEDISSNVRDAMRARAEAGKHHGRPPAWIKIDGGAYVLDDGAADTLRRLVALRTAMIGHNAIAATLNAEGRQTPSGSPWRGSSVSRHLSEDFVKRLAGFALYGKGGARIETPSVFPAVLTPDMAAALAASEARLAERAGHLSPWPVNRRASSTTFLLTGRLVCGACGTPMAGHAPHGYQCPAAGAYPDAHRGVGSTISGLIADEAVRVALRAAYARYVSLPPRAPAKRKAPPEAPKRSRLQIEQIRAGLDHLKASGVLSAADYGRQMAALKADEKALRQWEERRVDDAGFEWEAAPPAAKDERAARRALVLHLTTKIVAPIFRAGDPLTRGGNRPRWMAVHLRAPLPDGTAIVVVRLRRASFAGDPEVEFEGA